MCRSEEGVLRDLFLSQMHHQQLPRHPRRPPSSELPSSLGSLPSTFSGAIYNIRQAAGKWEESSGPRGEERRYFRKLKASRSHRRLAASLLQHIWGCILAT